MFQPVLSSISSDTAMYIPILATAGWGKCSSWLPCLRIHYHRGTCQRHRLQCMPGNLREQTASGRRRHGTARKIKKNRFTSLGSCFPSYNRGIQRVAYLPQPVVCWNVAMSPTWLSGTMLVCAVLFLAATTCTWRGDLVEATDQTDCK